MIKAVWLLFLSLTFISFEAISQDNQEDFAPFLAKTSKKTFLKTEPDVSSKTKLNLLAGAKIYVFSENETNGYVKVIDIKTNKLGYVLSAALKKVEDLPLSQGNSFQESGESSGTNPEVEIKNTTSLTISLIVGNDYFSLPPHTTSTKTINSGDQPFTASAPTVIPLVGRHTFKEGGKYAWTFTLRTTYRKR